MRCPYCGSLDDKVIESRTATTGESIRRRRECLSCQCRFTSYEHIEEKPFMVIKRDGSREKFDLSKIENGINRAIEKRPIPTQTIEQIISEIEDDVFVNGKMNREISTSKIGEVVLQKLYELDKVAYIRFASVYKHFETLDEFIIEVKNIARKEI